MKLKTVNTRISCPNCGQAAEVAVDCRWCHYPLIPSRAAIKDTVAPENAKSVKKLIDNFFTAALIVIIAVLALLHISPDYGIYVVRSGSMTPAIRTGDIIITGPSEGFLSREVKPGTIVTYKRGKELVTHRVESMDGDKLVTRGDALEEADPWQVNISDVIGTYLFKIPYIGYLPYFARTRLGWFLLILLPAAVLVGLLVKDIIKEAFKP